MSAARDREAKALFSTGKEAVANDVALTPESRAIDRGSDRASDAELTDVPAAVVCAVCGDSECAGCDLEQTRSGIIALVPWERPRLGFFDRLWATSRAATRESEAFFAILPDGPIASAIVFALVAELFAVTSFALVFSLILAAVAWPLLANALSDPGTISFVARAFLVGLPAIVLFLTAAHVVHGVFIDIGARRAGAKGSRRRAIRFGLYAAGWDLVLAPAGLVLALTRDGVRSIGKIAASVNGLPTRSASAFLRGTYGIDGNAQRGPLFMATLGAVVATILGAGLIIALVALAFTL